MGSANMAKAQAGLCPPNLDFEAGDFTNWVCRAGTVSVVGGINTVTWSSIGPPVFDRHTIITLGSAGTDPWGGFPEICPNGSGFSAKLGNGTATLNGGIGREASGASYTYTIPASSTVFSIFFHYAVVLQNPTHSPEQQPRFRARIRDLTTGLTIPCVTFDFTASSSLPGFLPSPSDPTVLYKDWTPVTLNLSGLAGRTIELEFIATECTQNGHFGYAYIDVNSNCNGAISGTTICQGDTTITLTAPYGFQSYEWYSDNTFATILSTTQTLLLDPPPTVGSVFPVVVTPYPGFGCRDTLYATITISANPVSNAGPDVTDCSQAQVQIGGPSTPGYTYAWTPASQVTNPIISNPLAWTIPPGSTEFIVHTTDILTGCSSYDTTIVSNAYVDTALTLNGLNTYCAGNSAAGTLSVNTAVAAVQWYNGLTPIPGATGYSYQPTVSGNYWAQVQQSGCTDSTATINFNINPIPVSNAGADASICVNSTIQIGAPPNPAYTYSWIPAAQVNNATIANPLASVTGVTPVAFIVHTTDPATGCNSYDTTIITGRVVDTSLRLNGKNDFCNGDPAAGTLSVNAAVTAVQWYDGANPIPGATGFNYQPLAPGNYWAQVQQFGCTDSTATMLFSIHANPLASFTSSNDSGCVTNNSFVFTNTSNVSDGSTLSHLWKFSDGTTQNVTDAVKTFSTIGNHTVKLITTTTFGCADSTVNTIVHVLPNGNADFKWDSVCVSRPVYFYNLTNENGSVQVNYNWNFNNGGPGSNIKNPLPVIYTTPGLIDVTLTLTALGCENDPDSITKKVQVNVQKPGITYRTITVPQGSLQYIHARDGIGNFFNWRPQTQLSNYNSRYTEFLAVDDVKYLIDISDIHTCVTTDTLQMLVLKKPGYYLATAFTPNGDGLNDLATPYLVGMKALKNFSVYNRWGTLIFSTGTYGRGWDGKYQGINQDTGVYVWILEFYNNDNKLIREKGTITLIR